MEDAVWMKNLYSALKHMDELKRELTKRKIYAFYIDKRECKVLPEEVDILFQTYDVKIADEE